MKVAIEVAIMELVEVEVDVVDSESTVTAVTDLAWYSVVNS